MHRPRRASPPFPFALRLLVVCLGVCALPARAQESEASTSSPERLEQDCTAGNARACDTLGDLYDEGRGVNKDERRAASLYEQACRGGVARGCNNLAILYQDGRGVERNGRRAADLYEEACNARYANACTNLGLLYLFGNGVAKNEPRASRHFETACNAGQGDACSHLAAMYEKGQGITKDGRRAARFSQKACELGELSRCIPVRPPEYARPREPELPPDEGTTLSLFFTLGGQGGGEPLLEASYTDGSTRKLGAGDAATFALGVMMEPVGGTPHLLQLQANGGFNIMSIAGIFWSHWSWELLGFYAYKPFNLRIGGGFQYNSHLGLEGTGSFAGSKVPFDDSLGLLVQADWQLSFLSFYLRYTSVAFKPTGAPAGFPANSIGAGMSIVLKVL